MDRIDQAICFATAAFTGQRRKCENYPAIFHSLEAGCIAQTLTDDEDIVIATILHDTVEDAGCTFDQIESKFGARVAELVRGESEDKREGEDPSSTWQIRKQESLDVLRQSEDRGLKILFLSDKLSNIRSLYRSRLKFGNSMWDSFHQSDPKAHKWYYGVIAEALAELSDTTAYREYVELTDKTFSEEQNG